MEILCACSNPYTTPDRIGFATRLTNKVYKIIITMKLYFPCLLKLRTCYGSRLGNRRLTLDHESLITGGVVRMDGWMTSPSIISHHHQQGIMNHLTIKAMESRVFYWFFNYCINNYKTITSVQYSTSSLDNNNRLVASTRFGPSQWIDKIWVSVSFSDCCAVPSKWAAPSTIHLYRLHWLLYTTERCLTSGHNDVLLIYSDGPGKSTGALFQSLIKQ